MSATVVYERDDSQLAPEIDPPTCERCGRRPAEHRLYSGRHSTRRGRRGVKVVRHRDHVHLTCDECVPAHAHRAAVHEYWVPAA